MMEIDSLFSLKFTTLHDSQKQIGQQLEFRIECNIERSLDKQKWMRKETWVARTYEETQIRKHSIMKVLLES